MNSENACLKLSKKWTRDNQHFKKSYVANILWQSATASLRRGEPTLRAEVPSTQPNNSVLIQWKGRGCGHAGMRGQNPKAGSQMSWMHEEPPVHMHVSEAVTILAQAWLLYGSSIPSLDEKAKASVCLSIMARPPLCFPLSAVLELPVHWRWAGSHLMALCLLQSPSFLGLPYCSWS